MDEHDPGCPCRFMNPIDRLTCEARQRSEAVADEADSIGAQRDSLAT
jgi:hypothetical protein